MLFYKGIVKVFIDCGNGRGNENDRRQKKDYFFFIDIKILVFFMVKILNIVKMIIFFFGIDRLI